MTFNISQTSIRKQMFSLKSKSPTGQNNYVKVFFRGYASYVLSAFLYICVCQIKAQEVNHLTSNDNDEIAFFSTVNETGGYITQKLHQEFWDLMKKKYHQTELEKMISNIDYNLELLKDFQEQTWKNAKNCYFAKKVVKDETYSALQEKLLKQESFLFSSQVIIENAQKIINAAATRRSLDLGLGKFYITPELIEENMAGIKGSSERLKLLLTPFWRNELKEYFLPLINISLLSLYSPDEYHEFIQQKDEQIDIHIAQLNVDKNAIFEIGTIEYQKGDKKFSNFTSQERQIYIQEFIKEQFAGYQVEDPLLSKGTWRNYEFSKGIASRETDSIVIMSSFVNNKAFYIKYVTNANLALANSEFNEFTKRIQIFEGASGKS